MRIKQTARKSTASAPADPLRRAYGRLLETKRNSAGAAPPKREPGDPSESSSQPGPSTSGQPSQRQSLPARPSRGKQITFAARPEPTERVKVKPKRRLRPGQGVAKEIRSLQKGWDLQIPRRSFHRLVRELTLALCSDNGNELTMKYQAAALEALQEASEAYLVALFEDSYLCTVHAHRKTLFPSDMELCRKLRERMKSI